MKHKVISLFENKIIVQNQGVKYSKLLEQFLTPFKEDFEDVEYYEHIIELGIAAWNFANMISIFPEGESDSLLNAAKDKNIDVELFKRLIDHKAAKFKKYKNFIVDYDLEEKSGDIILKITTQEQESYLSSMSDNIQNKESLEEFEENYINRNAIILKPLQPFIDWIEKLFPEEEFQGNEVTTYLVDENIDNLEAWLLKKYDKIFTFELEGWSTNKKEWPQKRSYKMFKEWFRVEVSTLVFDFEKKPVSKAE